MHVGEVLRFTHFDACWWNVAIYAFCQAQNFGCQAPSTILHPWSVPPRKMTWGLTSRRKDSVNLSTCPHISVEVLLINLMRSVIAIVDYSIVILDQEIPLSKLCSFRYSWPGSPSGFFNESGCRHFLSLLFRPWLSHLHCHREWVRILW